MISMPDSITPGNIPLGYAAVLGYADGRWATASRLPELFPKSRHVILTVTGQAPRADGIDCEPGNVNSVRAADWVRARLAAEPSFRPVVYADLASEGYSMTEVLTWLTRSGVARSRVRLLTAHYDGEHLCSPERGCRDSAGRVITFTADGTQWTSTFPGVGGAAIDMSVLADDFFDPPPPPADWVFGSVRWLTARAGPHSVQLTFSAPGTPMPAGVAWYEVTIRHQGQDVPSYPRQIPKGANPQVWQGGSLMPGITYEALVRAVAEGGKHASAWAAVTFTTPFG